MLFNSIEYALFLPIVFILYWLFSKQYKIQNVLIVIASYIFYVWWDWRFLILIAFTSLCSWGSGILIEESKSPKCWLAANIVVNLLILCIFKYYNFFVTLMRYILPTIRFSKWIIDILGLYIFYLHFLMWKEA